MPYLSGNKTTVGYVSPLTGLPHYSFVGGRAFAQLLYLGVDALAFPGSQRAGAGESCGDLYAVISGFAPRLSVEWHDAKDLPAGQRSAFYWLLERELDGREEDGSVCTIGHAARYGYRTANLAVDGLYHAGRGGAGAVFWQFAAALVLRGESMSWRQWLGDSAEDFSKLREGEIRRRLEADTQRLSRRDGGTITKLWATGGSGTPTLPARNAQQLGHPAAQLGSPSVLLAVREGQTGCHWCQVNCRHWHSIDADYAPGGQDRLLDDFEPAYAIYAMLDLKPDAAADQARLRLLQEVERQVTVPIEEMGCDVLDLGIALAALFEGLETGAIPRQDVPPFLHGGPYLGNLRLAAQAVEALWSGTESPALRAVGDGPQALVQQYPTLADIVFTSGRQTLGNAGHANQLWTFLMPFGRFFGHYVAQTYKIAGDLPSDSSPEMAGPLFRHVIREALQREQFGVLCNALSACAFTFVLFSQDGKGWALDDSDLLVRTLACYGIETSRQELMWFAEAFWASSMAFKLELGWRLPSAADYPERVFEVLSKVLNRPVAELRALMDQLIEEWSTQAGEILYKHGTNYRTDSLRTSDATRAGSA
jgi:aldehyde:ferredoxin oxidoreductase